MKKSVVALALVGILPVVSANAGGYRSSSSAGIGGQSRGDIMRNNYSQYRQDYNDKQANKKTKKSQQRKYFLSHPFFQPLQGSFGSLTDISYAQAKMDVSLISTNVMELDSSNSAYYGNILPFATIKQLLSDAGREWVDLKSTETTTQFLVTENISYGISDTLALMVKAQYDKTDMKVSNWSDGSAGTKTSTSGLNTFGIGLQARVADTADYIAMLSAQYQYLKDTANSIMAELKIGTKVERLTWYGILRAQYDKLNNKTAYGAYMEEDDGDWFMFTYKLDTKDVFQVFGGAGVFGVFNKYMTGKAELTYGSCDWHNQLNLYGEIGFQPGDNFALNLYASTALYDSAKGKTLRYLNYDVNPEALGLDTSGVADDQKLNPASKLQYTFGDYKLDKYNEWKVGIQAVLYF